MNSNSHAVADPEQGTGTPDPDWVIRFSGLMAQAFALSVDATYFCLINHLKAKQKLFFKIFALLLMLLVSCLSSWRKVFDWTDKLCSTIETAAKITGGVHVTIGSVLLIFEKAETYKVLWISMFVLFGISMVLDFLGAWASLTVDRATHAARDENDQTTHDANNQRQAEVNATGGSSHQRPTEGIGDLVRDLQLQRQTNQKSTEDLEKELRMKYLSMCETHNQEHSYAMEELKKCQENASKYAEEVKTSRDELKAEKTRYQQLQTNLKREFNEDLKKELQQMLYRVTSKLN